MQSEALMLYKLIILYILDRIDIPISNTELINFILEKEYTTYFNIQQALSELIEDDFVAKEETHSTSLYSLTPSGRETLSYFYTDIAVSIRDDIDAYLEDKKYQLKEQVTISADYYAQKTNEYIVELKAQERGSELIRLQLLVTSAGEADTMCNHWKMMSSDIYGFLFSSLMTGRLIQIEPTPAVNTEADTEA